MSVRADAPRRALFPERVAYSNGMLLDEADFLADQAYHRGRLAMLMRYLHGHGTVAGLNVTIDTEGEPMVVVAPGLALDRAGRVIESPLPLCLSLPRWFEDRAGDDTAPRVRSGSGSTPDHVVADVFLGFRECEIAKRPSFTRGAFDALGAVAPLRLRDGVEATLVPRDEDDPPLPRPAGPELSGNADARRQALDQHKLTDAWVEDIWWDGIEGGLARDREHPDGVNPADLFLARVRVPARAGDPPDFDAEASPEVTNDGRPMVYSTTDLMLLAR